MRYFFNLDKAYNREQALINGEYAPPIVLTAETPEIIDEWENNPDSKWWAVYKFNAPSWEAGDFASLEEAEDAFYANEGDSVYCHIHDC